MNSYQSKEYIRSRNAYSVFCMLQYFIAITVSDAYLSKLLLTLGLTDAQIGVILSIVSVGFLFGISAIFLAGKIHFLRKYVIFNNMLSLVLFSLLYLIPFLNLSKGIRTPLVVGCILLGYYARYSVEAMTSRWGNSYVSPDHRGDFSASKVNLSLAGGILFSLSIGFLFDYYEEKGHIQYAFLLVVFVGMFFNIGSFICLRNISKINIDSDQSDAAPPFREIISILFSMPAYRSMVILNSLYLASYYLSSSFMGTYKLNELAFSVGEVQIITMLGNLSRFALSHPIGRYSDRKSFAKGITLGLVILAFSFAVNIFSSPSHRFFVIVYTLAFNVAMCGTGQNMENILYSYVPVKYYVQASAIKSAISGVVGFLATLVGSAILNAVQANGNRIGAFPIYGQQILSLLCLALAIIAILFSRLVIEKQKNMHQ